MKIKGLTLGITMVLITGLLGMISMQADAATSSTYDSAYTETVSFETSTAEGLKKNTGEAMIYRQLKLGLQYNTINEGMIVHMYEDDATSIPVSVLTQLYEDGLIGGYVYKYIAGGSLTQEDLADVFDWQEYYALNPDLQGVIAYDAESLFKHFLTNGMKEARAGSEEFQPSIYMANYPEVVTEYGTNYPMYYYHYICYGKQEGREGSERLDD